MSYFTPVPIAAAGASSADLKSSATEFHLDESTTPFFRSFDSGLHASASSDSHAFFASATADDSNTVFRSVGADGSLAMPSFATAPVMRSTQHDADADDTNDDGVPTNGADHWGATAVASSSSSSAAAALKSLSLPSVVAAAVDVEEAPAFIERHSSFLTYTAPTDVCAALMTIMDSQSVQSQYTPNKHKIRGVVLADSVSASFVIRVWRRTAESAFLVEFQRRSGCVVTFTNFYRACTQSLAHIIIGSTPSPVTIRKISPVPFELTLNAGQPMAGSVTLDQPTLSALTEMAGSADSVCAAEAMRVLSRAVSTSTANKQFVLAASSQSSSPVNGLLTKTVVSPNAYIQLLAVKLAVALVTVAAVVPVRIALMKLITAASVTALAATDLLARETVRVLSAVTGASHTGVASDKLALRSVSAVSVGRPAVAASVHDKLSLASGFAPVDVSNSSRSDALSFSEF